MLNNGLFKKLIFNKYKVQNLLHLSTKGSVYKGVNIKDNTPVAIKLIKKNEKYNLLESEAYYLYYIKGFGIPKIFSYGHFGIYNVLIEELLGKSLIQIFNEKSQKKFNIKDICLIALQSIDRLEYIHSKFLVHRDIKPDNFVIGRNNPNVIYLIDFEYSHKYKSSRTGKHIRFKTLKYAYGSLGYLSINGNKGYEQTRRDDLESLGYMLIFLATGTLPWFQVEKLKLNKVEKYFFVYKIKKSLNSKILCKDLPEEIAKYYDYCKGLFFEEEPDYNYLRSLFKTILIRINHKNDFNFSWISNKIINQSSGKIENSIVQRKRFSPHTRLLKKIELSLSKKRNQNNSNILRKKIDPSIIHINLEANINKIDKEIKCNKNNSNFIIDKNSEEKRNIFKEEQTERENMLNKYDKNNIMDETTNREDLKGIISISLENTKRLKSRKKEIGENDNEACGEISNKLVSKKRKINLKQFQNYSKKSNLKLLENYQKFQKKKKIKKMDDEDNTFHDINNDGNINTEYYPKKNRIYEKIGGGNKLFFACENKIHSKAKTNDLFNINKNTINNEKNIESETDIFSIKKIINKNNIAKKINIMNENNIINKNKENKINKEKTQVKKINFILRKDFWPKQANKQENNLNSINSDLSFCYTSNLYNNKNNKNLSFQNTNLNNINNMNRIVSDYHSNYKKKLFYNKKLISLSSDKYTYNPIYFSGNYECHTKSNPNKEKSNLNKSNDNNKILSDNNIYNNQLKKRKREKIPRGNYNDYCFDNKRNSNYPSKPNIINIININALNNYNNILRINEMKKK